MASEVIIRGHGGEIGITVLGYENLAAEIPSDANWLTCRVRVVLGVWRGEVKAAFTTGDFMTFAAQLRELLQGARQASAFETDEGALKVKIEMARTGSCRVRGFVADVNGPEVKMTFGFESDQSFLRPLVNGLESITERFPVRA